MENKAVVSKKKPVKSIIKEGVKNEIKKEEEIKEAKVVDVLSIPVKAEVVAEILVQAPKTVTVAKPALEPLRAGQKYFEAPDGEIVIGEEDKSQLWHRKMNGGRGGWINPKR